MDFQGLMIGVITFVIIGIFHPIVIKSEYYIGKKIWPAFLALGILCIVLSLFANNVVVSAVFGITGFTFFWSIKEIIEQEERVKKGWSPANPKKTVVEYFYGY